MIILSRDLTQSSAWMLIDMVGCTFNLAEALVFHLGPKVLPSNLAPAAWDSTLYPPLFNEPWNSDSMFDFWSRGVKPLPPPFVFSPFCLFEIKYTSRLLHYLWCWFIDTIFGQLTCTSDGRSSGWHAIFRQHILFCGATPFSWILKPLGKDVGSLAGLMGAMTFSGLFHEFGSFSYVSFFLKKKTGLTCK